MHAGAVLQPWRRRQRVSGAGQPLQLPGQCAVRAAQCHARGRACGWAAAAAPDLQQQRERHGRCACRCAGGRCWRRRRCAASTRHAAGRPRRVRGAVAALCGGGAGVWGAELLESAGWLPAGRRQRVQAHGCAMHALLHARACTRMPCHVRRSSLACLCCSARRRRHHRAVPAALGRAPRARRQPAAGGAVQPTQRRRHGAAGL